MPPEIIELFKSVCEKMRKADYVMSSGISGMAHLLTSNCAILLWGISPSTKFSKNRTMQWKPIENT